MLRTLAVSRVVLAAALLALVPAITGCSGGGGSGLDVALSRVADTANTRSEIFYDDTAELDRLAGTHQVTTKGFAVLRGLGATLIAQGTFMGPQQVGINLYGDYAVTAGSPPQILTLIAGGQNRSLAASRLTKLGWKRNGSRLLAPPASGAGSTAQYATVFAQVQLSGSDVLVGSPRADLSQIGAPSGPTLASDPGISALVTCLGNVVAAEIFSGADFGPSKPAAVAVGVSQPTSNTATPHAVACVAWPTQAAAAQYATNLRKALSSGVSAVSGNHYSAMLANASVTTPGGSQHVVEWQADTPGSANEVFALVENVDLPGLTRLRDQGILPGPAVGCDLVVIGGGRARVARLSRSPW